MGGVIWVPCPDCGGLGTVRDRGGHGDWDTVLCGRCNPDPRKRMLGERCETTGRVAVPKGVAFVFDDRPPRIHFSSAEDIVVKNSSGAKGFVAGPGINSVEDS